MEVYKFGGASIESPERMKALLPIILEQEQPLLVVLSAYGKTTNALEELVHFACDNQTEKAHQKLKEIETLHTNYAQDISSGNHLITLKDRLETHYTELKWAVDDAPLNSKDYTYDQIVCIGELLSSTIFSAYLSQQNIKNIWLDVRDLIRTDTNYRNAAVDKEWTKKRIQEKTLPYLKKGILVITQGFIGSTSDNTTTTLGREGSDYTAALFAALLPAKKVSIWKDTPGLLNADPRQFSDTVKIDQISYHEVIEMAYYGAQIIHPKTIKPLQNANIPLYVKCFLDPQLSGTLIHNPPIEISYPPLIILKKKQVLIQMTTKDFSFISEKSIMEVYQIFLEKNLKINLIQNAAISLVICVDFSADKIKEVISKLEINFKVLRNEEMNLLTIRHYKEGMEKAIIGNKSILLEQKTRTTLQLVF